MKTFLAALRFLTRLPLPTASETTPSTAAASMALFPLAGALLGLLLVLSDAALRLALPIAPASALLLAIWILLTGGLHLDGFIDCCDGLWVAKTPAERLAILRDVHAGAYGVSGAALLLIIKFAALVALPPSLRWTLLLLAPIAGRWAMVYAAQRYPYARRDAGLGLYFKTALRPLHLIVASSIALILSLAAHLWIGPAALALTWLLTLAVCAWAANRLGGLTGDVYGFLCEIIEPAVLLAGIMAARFMGLGS